jgi:hypothetical protein
VERSARKPPYFSSKMRSDDRKSSRRRPSGRSTCTICSGGRDD